MDRAQCLIVKNHKILMVKHRENGTAYYCLPGGGIEPGETPEIAALRELKEECLVDGYSLKLISTVIHDNHINYTFYADIGTQKPALGFDPEISGIPVLSGVSWCTLETLSERERAFLWSAGLIYYDAFSKELNSWSDDISYPRKRTQQI